MPNVSARSCTMARAIWGRAEYWPRNIEAVGGFLRMATPDSLSERPHTVALIRALASMRDPRTFDDLLYLEAWERDPAPSLASTLRIGQIRRANPELAAEIRA